MVRDELGRRAHEVERGPVAPVQVLEDDEPPAALGDRRADDELGRRALERLALERLLVLELDRRAARARRARSARGSPRTAIAPIVAAIFVARDLGRIALLDARALADQPPVLRVRLHRVVRHAGPVVPPALVLRLELATRSRRPPRRAGSCRCPGSPTSRSAVPTPSPVRSSAERTRSARARARRAGPRATAPRARARARRDARGRGTPRRARACPSRSIRPRSSTSNRSATSRYVSSVICTVPGSAVCSIRAATFTASPIAVYSCRRSEPTCADDDRTGVDPDADVEIEPRSRAQPLA